jgi:RNA 2',3'-cyclic 3'-phosphodiesterase
MPRLFVAIDLPDPIKNQLETMLTGVPGAKWVKRHQLHLTLRFIGEVETPRLQEIKQALQAVRAEPFTMTLQGAGRFPPKGASRVLWVGVAAPAALAQLQRSIEQAVVSVGILPEERPFSAHITLARLKSPPPPQTVERYLAQRADFKTGSIPISEFILYSSVLSPQGPTYRPEARFALRVYNKVKGEEP